jgi:hypothetical protein
MAELSKILVEQWHPTANVDLLPANFTASSGKKVHWLCKLGHEWQSRIADRTKGQGCPTCTGRRILPGFNDLRTKYPEIADEWHPTKNHLNILTVAVFSNKKAWWLGKCGHEWETVVSHRTKHGTGCSYCSGKYTLKGFNDLVTTHPEMASQWDEDKNGALLVTNITAGSNKRVWWKDEFGHSWIACPATRTNQQQGCPVCSNQKIVSGINDLATTHPLLLSKWHPSKNTLIQPDSVSAGSNKIVWWKDKYGHEWKSPIVAQIKGGCAICANKKVLEGFNDLQTIRPEIAAEWHPTRNLPLLPNQVTSGTDFYAWWRCIEEHEWQAYVYNRTSKNKPTVCPECSAYGRASKPEEELYNFISSFGLATEKANRKVLGNRKEVDLYIPELKLAVEFNGIYWHNEGWKGEVYHYEKWVAAKAVGIKLFQIWEDNWRHRKDIILRLLTARLGVTDQLPTLYPELTQGLTSVDAAELNVIDVDIDRCEQFMTTNHLHGFEARGQHVGLEGVDGVLRAVLTVSKHESDTLQVERYAAAGSVTGGFERLLSHVMAETGVNTVVADVDHASDDGSWLTTAGFEPVQEFEPDYMYVVAMKRVPKTMFTPEYFQNHPRYVWEEGFSSRELADKNRVPRIWDAGHTRYQLKIK